MCATTFFLTNSIFAWTRGTRLLGLVGSLNKQSFETHMHPLRHKSIHFMSETQENKQTSFGLVLWFL